MPPPPTRSQRLWRRVAGLSPLVQGTAAATAAWIIARRVIDHHEPFFAPIAAVVALNTQLGERGSNALRLLLGVLVGITAGELTLLAFGGGYGRLALATFVAMLVARALGGARIVIAQAAASAILTVAVARGEAGTNRLEDALIGAGVALLFSQVLFSPEPLALLRRAEAAALAGMAKGLAQSARALAEDNEALAAQATDDLRELPDRLAELGRIRKASTRIVRHSAVWRDRMVPVVREKEDAGHLDLLGGSCLLLARTAAVASPAERRALAPSVRALADALGDLAQAPADGTARQEAVDRALAVARELTGTEAPGGSALEAATVAARLVTADILIFAGVPPGDALELVRRGAAEFHVDPPPPTSRFPFGLDRRRRPRS